MMRRMMMMIRITNYPIKNNRSVILVTHQVQYHGHADHVTTGDDDD